MMSSTLHTAGEFRETYGDRTWEHYRPLVAILVEFAPPGRFLDAGAGTGLLVECCRRFGIPCVGLEGSEAGAWIARERGVDLVVGILEEGLPFADGAFTAVVANQVLEHLHRSTADLFLREARRVLAPGGVVLIQSPSPRDRRQAREPGHINLYTPSRLRKAVREAGLEVVAERNGAIAPLGGGRIPSLFFQGLLRLTGWADLLSASANVVARREDGP